MEIGPDNSLAKLFLAEAYLKEDRDDEARRLLEEILMMAPDEGYEFEFRENQEEARRLLSEHFQGALNTHPDPNTTGRPLWTRLLVSSRRL